MSKETKEGSKERETQSPKTELELVVEFSNRVKPLLKKLGEITDEYNSIKGENNASSTIAIVKFGGLYIEFGHGSKKSISDSLTAVYCQETVLYRTLDRIRDSIIVDARTETDITFQLMKKVFGDSSNLQSGIDKQLKVKDGEVILKEVTDSKE